MRNNPLAILGYMQFRAGDKQGHLRAGTGACLKTFHFQSVYAYVLEKTCLNAPEFQRYIPTHAEHIRCSGLDIDIWGYESFHD